MKNLMYIILPVHNRKELTRNFIENLKRQTYQDYHLVLVDDGSTDGTIEAVKELMPDFTLIAGNGNLWWGGSLHESYKWIKGANLDKEAIILIINDDTIIENNYLETAATIIRDKERAIVLSENYDKDTLELSDVGFHIDWKKLRITKETKMDQVNCFSTRGLVMRVKDFLEIGGFYPVMLPHYLSDLEFTYRANKKGFQLLSSEKLKIYSSEKTSGFRNFDHYKSFWKFLKHYMSKKNTTNPIHWMNFITISAPLKYIPLNIARVTTNSLVTILKMFYKIHFSSRLQSQ